MRPDIDILEYELKYKDDPMVMALLKEYAVYAPSFPRPVTKSIIPQKKKGKKKK